MAILRDWGIRLDRDTPMQEIAAMLEVPDPSPPPTVVDIWRDAIMRFIEENRIIVQEQMSCDGNCYNHPDALVAACYSNVRELIGGKVAGKRKKAGGPK